MMSTWVLAAVLGAVVATGVVAMSWARLLGVRRRSRGMSTHLGGGGRVAGSVGAAATTVTILLLVVYFSVGNQPLGVAAIFSVTGVVGLIGAYAYCFAVNDAVAASQHSASDTYPQPW